MMTHNSIDTAVTRFLEDEGVDFRLLHHSKPAKTIEEAALERGVDPTLSNWSNLFCSKIWQGFMF